LKKTHDYIHYYRGYWSDGGKCRIRIYREDGQAPVVICSQLPDNPNTSVTNMAEYLAAEVMEKHKLPTPLVWIEHYPEHEGEIGECSLVRFSSWEPTEVCLGSVWRHRIGSPAWSPLRPEEAQAVLGVHHISGGADAPEEDHRPDSRSGACFVWVHRRRT
jgi:hypothetical protein